jgi:hypothetical protein
MRFAVRGKSAFVTSHRATTFVPYANPDSITSQLQVDVHLTLTVFQGVGYKLFNHVQQHGNVRTERPRLSEGCTPLVNMGLNPRRWSEGLHDGGYGGKHGVSTTRLQSC